MVDVENAITQFLGYDSPTCCYIEIGVFANTLLLICVAIHVHYNVRDHLRRPSASMSWSCR
jgi:hypothetical protein